ncbi:MAG: type II toxin-antitoxin system RelE/ParE family toxin [Thermodesulfobacteriota bacterium]
MSLKYDLFIERRAQRELAKISPPHQDRIIAAIKELADEPRPAGAKKLSGREGWRIRIGEYRVLHEIKDEVPSLLVVAVGHRRDIYRK